MLEPVHKVGCIRTKHILKEQALREYCPEKTFVLHFFLTISKALWSKPCNRAAAVTVFGRICGILDTYY